jgi:hypothetical protein
MFGLTNVRVDKCSGWQMFGLANVRVNKCLGWQMCGSTNVWVNECLGRQMFGSMNVQVDDFTGQQIFVASMYYLCPKILHPGGIRTDALQLLSRMRCHWARDFFLCSQYCNMQNIYVTFFAQTTAFSCKHLVTTLFF